MRQETPQVEHIVFLPHGCYEYQQQEVDMSTAFEGS